MKLLVAAIAFVGGTLLAPELGGKAPLVALFLFALTAAARRIVVRKHAVVALARANRARLHIRSHARGADRRRANANVCKSAFASG